MLIQRTFLVFLLLLAVGFLIASLVGMTSFPHVTVAKLVGSSGLFLDIAGIVQLESSGAFEKLMDKYGNVEDYPYGPPSHVTRRIIDDADAPLKTALRNHLFFEHRTGIWFLVAGFVLQLSAVWIWI
jgi:hypothetical protein